MTNMNKLILILGLVMWFKPVFSQSNVGLDTTLNNLVLPPDYQTIEYNSVPYYEKMGRGKTTLILIPGLGFDGSVFKDFVAANKKRYTMYVVTLPGFGKTKAPAAPKEGTSLGEYTWSKSAAEGIVKLMDKEKLIQPVLVGNHTLSAQIVLRIASTYPDKVGKVVILGSPAKFVLIQNNKPVEYPLKSRIAYQDKVIAPTFYKFVTRETWNQNNYIREIYVLKNGRQADELWKQVASVPLPVMVRYLMEFQVTDPLMDIDRIQCPVLVLRPGFRQDWIEDSQNGSFNFIKPQFIDGWDKLREKNSKIEIVDIPDSGVFVWKDQPEKTYEYLLEFLKRSKDLD